MKPHLSFLEDNEDFATVEESELASIFKLEEGTGSIYIRVEDREGSDSDGDALLVGRTVAPNECFPPSWNLHILKEGRYVVYGTCVKDTELSGPSTLKDFVGSGIGLTSTVSVGADYSTLKSGYSSPDTGDGKEFVNSFNDFISRTPFESSPPLPGDINTVTVNRSLREARHEKITDSWRADKDVRVVQRRRTVDGVHKIARKIAKEEVKGAGAPFFKRKEQSMPQVVIPNHSEGEDVDGSSRGKRRFTDGRSTSLPISISSDTDSSVDPEESAEIPFHSIPFHSPARTADEDVIEHDAAKDIIYYDVSVRQFDLDVIETDVDETQWHIARTSGTSPACRARTGGQERSRRPICGAFVARRASGRFPAPTFRQPQQTFRNTRFASDRHGYA
ncbi:hypothetical protein R1sor_012640 [Riccia sorocarpa]|uniref:Uncharacterized protein n=1 Tax=Riccia sorocarpa TaxID=122646 RepID=A0ABD3I7L8_9MARC